MFHNYAHTITHSLIHAITISIFVLSMMVFIDYLNIATTGKWQEKLKKYVMGQNFIGAFLGATPGCLGVFVVISMYSHKIFRIGAVVAATIATSGDEAFVMFAMFPETALLLTLILFGVGLVSGFITDSFVKNRTINCPCDEQFIVHERKESPGFSLSRAIPNLKSKNPYFLIISVVLIIIFSFFTYKLISRGITLQNFIFSLVSFLAFMIVISSDEHFISEHLWDHIIKKHGPKIFLWTASAFIIINILIHNRFDTAIQGNSAIILLLAVLIGIIPESGPHLVFVTMFANGLVPFSVLLASSISQDGHGTLPLLAHSRRDFFIVKAINISVALLVGYGVMVFGF
ncbi:putative manganese transporter [Myxococcota bacterium]|nr:putative manganese transporter [Myxococcota bacterium]